MAERLEETCFMYVLKTLEEFDVNGKLSLLPAKIRSRMLVKMPLVDICRLEKTNFVSGLDMTLIWKQIYEERNASDSSFHGRVSQNNWKQSLLTRISNILLGDERPYGYFQLMTRADKGCPWVGRDITDQQPVHKHPIDLVNYLVAIYHEKSLPKDKETKNLSDEEDDDEWKKWQRRKYGPSYVVMARHDVILHKGIVPPADLYHRACQTKQLVSRRFAHYFSEGSSFLPDNIAIMLLSRECDFFPESIVVSNPQFSTFLYNAEHETSDLGFLRDYFKLVVSVTIRGDIEKNLKWKVNPGAKALSSVERVSKDQPELVGRSQRQEAARSRRQLRSSFANVVTKEESMQREVPSRVLGLILSNPSHAFTDLTIIIGKTSDQLLAKLTPHLISQFSGLRKLTISARGSVSPNLEKLLAITEHHQTLENVSISITEITQCFGSFGPVVKNTPEYSRPLMLSYLEKCFKKPSLSTLKVCFSPVTAEYIQRILVCFLAMPCCSDQTLIINFNLNDKECVVNSGILLPYPVDDNCTLQYKSLVLQRCSIPASLANWLFSFQPMKLKKVVIKDYSLLNISVFTSLARRKSFDVESVKFSSMYLSRAVTQDFTSLFEKPSLKSVYFKNCSALNLGALADGLTVQQRIQKLSEFRLSYKNSKEMKKLTTVL